MVQSCSMEDSFSGTIEIEKDLFPVHVEEYAKAVAKEIHLTVQNLNKMGVDYSNADNSLTFKEQFYKDWFNASQITTKSNVPIEQMLMSPTVFAEKIRNLTSLQVEFVEKIVDECIKSKSNEDLLNSLISITKEIQSSVPEIQQERLLRVTSVLYYCVTEIINLEKQGIMLITPYNKYTRVKTKSEGGDLVAGCRNFLTAVWTIAVGEPTPAGEIVASVATVIVAGVLMYDVVVCRKNIDYCEAMYDDCVNNGRLPSWQCYDCFRYCQAQNVWDCPRPY